ncbi:hypothetical protein BZZ01_25245 [Nostocales cyanobacterium HT-58-2]|nr:hypothetical protein BZZ01_25245 [Nostocales cyanobacterium HT-58-2]
MTNQEFQKETIVCGWCKYAENTVGATHCEKCGKPLIASVPTRERITRSTLFVGGLSLLAIVLLLFGVGGYFFWQPVKLSTTTDNSNSSSTSNLSSSSDIQLYNSMKEVPNVPEGTFNYGGAVLFASITSSGTHKAMTEAHRNFRLVYTEPTSGKPGNSRSLTMLLNGELSFAQIALPLTDAEYSKAKERGFALEQVPVAIDGIVVFTHPDLSIPGLSVDQLQEIYKGKITNWKQLGGPDLQILPFARPKVATLLHVLLGPEVDKVSPKVQYIRDYTEAIRKVASTPGAISFGGSGPLVGQKSVRFIPLAKAKTKEYVQPFIDDGKGLNATAFRDGSYPMIRRLFIAIRRDGKIDEQVGVAYTNMLLSKEGQQFVEKAGFLPLR